MASEAFNFLAVGSQKAYLQLALPLLLAIWMAWIDIKTNRIPNYLTLGSALAGLVFQLWAHGWPGLADGFMGLGLGFALMIFFYLKGGLGAGDVKAIAALGAWLGPGQTLYLFIYMAFSGVVILVGFLWWRGLLWGKIRRFYEFLVNFVLLRSFPPAPPTETATTPISEKMPYALAIVLGMAILFLQKLTN
jgi:prepilin peptidase CpaA